MSVIYLVSVAKRRGRDVGMMYVCMHACMCMEERVRKSECIRNGRERVREMESGACGFYCCSDCTQCSR